MLVALSRSADDGGAAVRLRIALLASACDPGRGSEPGIGWDWLCGLAELGHDVELVTGDDPAATGRTRAAFAAISGGATLTVHALPTPSLLPVLTTLLPVAMRDEGDALSRHLGWLSEVDKLVAAGGLSDVDVVHHVTLGSLNSGSVLGNLSQPVLFGPVGGGQRCPPALLPLLGRSGYAELARDAAWAARRRIGRRFAATMRRADVVFVANRDTARLASRYAPGRVELMMCDAITADSLLPAPPERDLAAPLLLWVGGLRPRKAPALALRAFRHVLVEFPAARLHVLGDGPLRPAMAALARELGLAGRVEFAGRVPHAEVRARYARATLLLLTSVRDSFGGQALDAWASAVPTVSFGHQGVGDFSPAVGSVLVGPCTAAAAPRRFAAAVAAVLGAPDRYPERCAAALAHAQRHTLQARTGRAVEIYAGLLDNAAGHGNRHSRVS
jgi:glycosyltransferase involved in cell wall biosynthesis